jgi:hypothetical protein
MERAMVAVAVQTTMLPLNIRSQKIRKRSLVRCLETTMMMMMMGTERQQQGDKARTTTINELN